MRSLDEFPGAGETEDGNLDWENFEDWDIDPDMAIFIENHIHCYDLYEENIRRAVKYHTRVSNQAKPDDQFPWLTSKFTEIGFSVSEGKVD